jgi:hypothetical protein
MDAASRTGGRARRLRRIVIWTILLLVIAEPLVMYHSLMRERDQRRQAITQSLQSESAIPDGGPGR